MTVKFIADLHLRPESPAIAGLFIEFLSGQDQDTEALYILGDLFEAWIGDDFIPPGIYPVIDALKQLSKNEVPVYFMHGNRDFLIREGFAEVTGCQLLPEYHVIDLYGTPTLLMHGDLLCTDDVDYMKFRQMVRNENWQQEFLSKTVEERIAIAQAARKESQQKTQQLAYEIMDVNNESVKKIMSQWNVSQLIHGHTHRPNTHHLEVDGKAATRIVLGDWYTQGSVLECNANGCQLRSLPLS